MRKKNIKQENDVRDTQLSEPFTSGNKRFGAQTPSSSSEMNECRYQGFQEPKRKSDMMQE